MASKTVLTVGLVMLVAGAALGYTASLLQYPGEEEVQELQTLKAEVQRFRTYMACIPPSHKEVEVTPDTWIHYNYGEEGDLMMIEIETTRKQGSPAWGYLPQGHPEMEFEHWALHIWFKNPEDACLDLEGLVEKLRDEGLNVEPAGEVSQPFSVKGRLLRVNGETVQVFVYSDLHSAANEAALVSRDGSSIGTTKIAWVSTPHFYMSGKMIVLYVGEDDKVAQMLDKLVGPQFAGR